jgi:hypothetical protein
MQSRHWAYPARNGQPPPSTALRGINAALRNAPAYQELDWNGEVVTAAARRRGNATAIPVAQLAAGQMKSYWYQASLSEFIIL